MENDDIIKEIQQLKKQYYEQVIINTEDKQANAAACILTAFEIVRKYIYQTDKTLTTTDIIPYLHTTDEISQVLRGYNKIIDWIQANYKMFDESEIGLSQQKWGNIKGNEINIYPYKFSEFCKIININEKQFLTGLKQHNLIKTLKNECKNTVKINGKSQRVVTVLQVMGKPITETHNQQDFEEIEDEELPF